MKNRHSRDLPVVRDLPHNILREIGRVIFSHAYVEWRISSTTDDLLNFTRVLGRLAARETLVMDRFDLLCDVISLKNVKTSIDLIGLRKTMVSATTQRDMLAHGTWGRDAQTKTFFLRLVRGSWKPLKIKKVQTGRSIKSGAPQYGIEECLSLSQLFNGIMLTVDKLHLDTLAQPAPSRQKSH
jgi:hypothetical protein